MEDKLLVGVFGSERTTLEAVRAIRKAGLEVADVFTPFPIHGMDEALGLPPSWLSKACFALGAGGLSFALAFQYWVSVFDWPMNIGGKPYHASPALVPVAFELTVLVAGVGTVLTFLAYRGLHPGRKPALAGRGACDDRFLVLVRAAGDPAGVREALARHGALSVETAEAR
ncbi:MAG: DUF3341 domain-containing protein [Elusimicrobia bacterium]|nr:DUF3341 domain-containing protein [Elusimicrobiota bacterium]